MKPISLIATAFATFLIFLGISSRPAAGATLSNAVIAGGVLILTVVVASWIMLFVKKRRDRQL